jgi:hypothetical protein
MSLSGMQERTSLDERYGRRPPRRRLVGIVVTAGVLVVAAVVWLFWAQPWTEADFWKSTGYEVVNDQAIDITWNVTLSEGQTAQCALAAQDDLHAIVGWKVVNVVGVADPTQQLTETVRTTAPADVGLAYRCWLP